MHLIKILYKDKTFDYISNLNSFFFSIKRGRNKKKRLTQGGKGWKEATDALIKQVF